LQEGRKNRENRCVRRLTDERESSWEKKMRNAAVGEPPNQNSKRRVASTGKEGRNTACKKRSGQIHEKKHGVVTAPSFTVGFREARCQPEGVL